MPKFQPISIKDDLRIGNADDEELATALTLIFPRGAQLTANEVEYRTADDEWALSLRYRAGKIVDATTGPAYTPAIKRQIADALLQAFDQSTPKIWRTPMFSLPTVEGWYRYADQFLIRPAPAEAARPPLAHAQHPWILEFAFFESSDFRIRNLRTQRRAHELLVVLNLLLGGQIGAPTTRGRHHWILTRSNDDLHSVSSEWLQEGYIIPGFDYMSDDFSDVSSWNPLAEVATEPYYGRLGFRLSENLGVPADMTLLCDAFHSLNRSQRDRFIRSCHWYHTADEVWTYSQSLHLISLIIAMECLAQGGEKRVATDASTKMFLDFMQEYAPGRPSRTRLNKIYEVRSLVGHGERLLSYDSPQGFGLHPTSTADRESGTVALLLARGAMVNWLVSRKVNTTRLLAADPYPNTPARKPGTKSEFKVITV